MLDFVDPSAVIRHGCASRGQARLDEGGQANGRPRRVSGQVRAGGPATLVEGLRGGPA